MWLSCLRVVKSSRGVEPFAFWVKYLFPQIFAQSLIVLSSCLLAVSVRVPCTRKCDTCKRYTKNANKQQLVVIGLCICPPDFPIRDNKTVDASRQAKKIEHYHQQIGIWVLLMNHLTRHKEIKTKFIGHWWTLFKNNFNNSGIYQFCKYHQYIASSVLTCPKI